MIHPTVSMRVRLAAVFTLLVGAMLVLVSVITYELLRNSLLAEIERDVSRRAEVFRAAAPVAPYRLDTFGAPDVFLQVSDGSGTPIARSGNLDNRDLPLPSQARRGEVVEVHLAGRPLFLTAAALGDGRHIVVARSPATTYGALSTLRQLLVGVVGAAMLLTAVISWLYARAALRPVGQVAAAARSVRDSRDLSRRVAHRGSRDEVGQLVATFNEMLTELQNAYRSLDQSNDRLRQFLADCSHELRTPLTRVRSTIDVLAKMDDDTGDTGDVAFRQQALDDVAAETDRMAVMVRQLLILARADVGSTIEPRPVRLAEIVDTAYRRAARMANGVKLLPPPDGALADTIVNGDADHLEQLLLILLDNAVKYTPPPGEVRLTTDRDAHTARITVADTGLGVPPQDIDRIFDRFYRGRNASAATGTGLGLAIAHWIATQHDGHIEVVSTPGTGSRFTLHLPVND